MDITETRLWRTAARDAAKQTAEQRKLILAYPDIAARLCNPPLGYARPDQWTGYIPPAYDRENAIGVTPLNDSPRRAALMELLEAAAEREDAQRRPPAARAHATRTHDNGGT